jgi:hypothetical protein
MPLFQLKALSISDSLLQNVNDSVTKTPSSSKIHSLYAGAGYGSNMIYLESSISKGKPYYSAIVTYGFKNSLYVSASSSHINGTSPFVAFSSLSFNYRHTLNSWFDVSADLAGYKTSTLLQQTLFSDFAFISLTSGFDWKLIYTKLSLAGVFSVNNRGYIQLRNSRYFKTSDLFNGKAFFSFDPNINLLFGEVIKISTTTGSSKYGYSSPFRHFKKNPINTTESVSSSFRLMDIEFSLPVTLNFDNFSIEAETGYILPAYTNQDYPAPKGFSFYLTAYFKIL